MKANAALRRPLKGPQDGGVINGAFWNPLKEPGGDEWGRRELPYRSPDGGMNESACGPREALKGALREGDE